MNRADLLEDMIHLGGNKVTCEFVWRCKDSLSVKLTQAVSELRTKLEPEGKTVVFHKELTPSDSWYSIENIELPAFTDKTTGQREMKDLWRP